MKAYHIKDWDSDHENSDTRKYTELLWFRTKVKLVGEGIGHTLAHPKGRGPHLYGMFKIIEQIAASAKRHERGWLVRNGSPLNALRMSNLIRLPVENFDEALKFFSTSPMDWLEYIEFPGESANGIAQSTPTGRLPGESPSDLPPTGRLPGESPTKTTPTARHREIARQISTTGEHTNVLTYEQRERERNGGFASKDESRAAQKDQIRATLATIKRLEAMPEEDRTVKQTEKLKKNRAILKAIQGKQTAGDFTPVEAEQ